MVISVLYGIGFQHRYPQITFDQAELYGENGENLKDFDLSEDGVLTATTIDPWINVNLECAVPIAAIQIHASDVNNLNGRLQIIDTDVWENRYKQLRNGINTYIWYDYDDLWMSQHLRFDLVNVEGASCGIKSLTINPAIVVWLIGFIRPALSTAIACLAVWILLHILTWVLQNRDQFLKWGVRQFELS